MIIGGEPTRSLECAFAAAMAAAGPFEQRPRLAVAVSGGADSMALCLLADAWARNRNGTVTALTVDHRLRPESTAEAAAVARWMADRGIGHVVLPWTGIKPRSGLQEKARHARYDLLSGWCRQSGVLHLLLGHHRQDQAETVLMRLSRGSGPIGLSAMAGVTETASVRLIRPLLAVPPGRLKAFLIQRGCDWIEDPSNRDPKYARARLRAALATSGADGMTSAAVTALAADMARVRALRDTAQWSLLARACSVHPAGFARLDIKPFAACPTPIALAALQGVLAAVGGRERGPAGDKLARLHRDVIADGTKTGVSLGGCRVARWRGGVLVSREDRGLPEPLPVIAGSRLFWDRRFRITLAAAESGHGAVRLMPLGRAGWEDLSRRCPDLRRRPMPAPVRTTVPVLADEAGVYSAPHLGFRRRRGPVPGVDFAAIDFRPTNPIAGAGCFLAYRESDTMSWS